jgi:hypothetical protein
MHEYVSKLRSLLPRILYSLAGLCISPDSLHSVARITYLNDIVKNDPKQEVNLKGWLRRVGNIKYGKLVCNDGRVINS